MTLPLLAGGLVAGPAPLLPGDATSRLLLDLSPAALLLVDDDGNVVYGNRAIIDLLGRPPGELRGRRFMDLVAAGSLAAVTKDLERATPGEPSPPRRIMLLGPGGRSVAVEMRVARGPGPAGGVRGVLLRDLRESEELVEALAVRGAELARSNRELEQFAYTASHDLREPLRMVSAYTKRIAERYQGKLDTEADRYLAITLEGTARMSALIDGLLSYSRLDASAAPFKVSSGEAWLAEAMSNLQSAIVASHAVVTHDPLPSLEVDSLQMVQVLQNLIGNALKFHGPGVPRVHIAAERKGAEWVFSVKDEGIGIPPEDQERVFTIFERLNAREEFEGSGIGLSICKKVILRHGGRIWLESTGVEGEGTTFFFTLPAHRAPTAPAVPAAPSATPRPLRAAEAKARNLIEERLREVL